MFYLCSLLHFVLFFIYFLFVWSQFTAHYIFILFCFIIFVLSLFTAHYSISVLFYIIFYLFFVCLSCLCSQLTTPFVTGRVEMDCRPRVHPGSCYQWRPDGSVDCVWSSPMTVGMCLMKNRSDAAQTDRGSVAVWWVWKWFLWTDHKSNITKHSEVNQPRRTILNEKDK